MRLAQLGLEKIHYYPEFSSERIITMDYMKGEHLSEFTAYNEDPELSQKLGQALCDFYMYQIHVLRNGKNLKIVMRS